MVVQLLQDDPRWKDIRICDDPPSTIGAEGCLLVCVSMANFILGNMLFPDQLVAELRRVDGLDPQGNLIWKALRQTSSLLWLCGEGSNPIPDLSVVKYKRPVGCHFVLKYKDTELDPKPNTTRLEELGARSFARIRVLDEV